MDFNRHKLNNILTLKALVNLKMVLLKKKTVTVWLTSQFNSMCSESVCVTLTLPQWQPENENSCYKYDIVTVKHLRNEVPAAAIHLRFHTLSGTPRGKEGEATNVANKAAVNESQVKQNNRGTVSNGAFLMDVYGDFITPERWFMWPIYKSVYAHSPSQSGFTDVSCSQTRPHSFCSRRLNKSPVQMKTMFISFQEWNTSVTTPKLRQLMGCCFSLIPSSHPKCSLLLGPCVGAVIAPTR